MSEGLADEIRAAETALRECIAWILRREHGSRWIDRTGLTLERVRELESKRTEEAARRPTVLPSVCLLDYTELYELHRIINHSSRWPLFKPVFGDRKRFDVWMHYLLSYRNPTMHSRDLVPHEESLLRGIAGEIRSAVTKARVSTDDMDRHFARIEGVRDSFGNVATDDNRIVDTDVLLRPGDQVKFRCEGFDPTGADLVWWWDDTHGANQLRHRSNGNVITWDVATRHIRGTPFHLMIFLLADRPFHRHGWHDGNVGFKYKVRPL